ncbi:MAG: 3-oxoacyl-[acyl-carrier-protein] reductase [Syntrophorhabdaceae bacterium]
MNGKVTIITGGAQGIGRAISEFLAEKGSDIAIFDIIDGTETKIAIESKGRRCEHYTVDVSDFGAAEKAVNQVARDFGKVDNLVNNAGITIDKLLVRMKEDDWDRVLRVNLKSVFNCTKACVRHMLKTGGSIVNISSIAGVMGNPGQANYAASKAGIIGFTKSVAKEYAERSIRVNAIAPGFIRTKMTDVLDARTKETMFGAIPLKRLGEPEDVANAVYFLLSHYSGYITGEVINVNGGLYM